MCLNPNAVSLLISSNGSRSVIFQPKNFSPGDYTDPDGFRHISFFVPCGLCLECKASHAREWAVRCLHELKNHEKACFITLTYDDDHLPSDCSLQIEDLQKFWKRLRKKYGKFRYFACGEYGEQNSRPHYHAIVFGLDFPPDQRNENGVKDNKDLSDVWQNGITSCDSVNFNTCCYVARYCVKKLSEKELAGRVPEFVVMSNRPGIGFNYAEQYGKDVMERGYIINKGFKIKLPRYYGKKVKDYDEEFYKLKKEENYKKINFENLDYHELDRKSRFLSYNNQKKRKGL